MSFSKFYFFTATASGLSCYILPNYRQHAITGLACLTGSILINKLYRWVSVKYGDKKLAVNLLDVCSKIGTITLLGYASRQFYFLSKLHTGLPGYFHYTTYIFYNLSTMATFYGMFISALVLPTYIFAGPLVTKILLKVAHRLSLTGQDANFVINVLQRISTGQYVSITYRGIKIFSTSNNPPLTEDDLNKIAPLSCPGLNNVPEQAETEFSNPDSCSVCMEKYTQQQLTRTLPCKHSFHAACIDQWLLQSTPACAICRQVIIPPVEATTE